MSRVHVREVVFQGLPFFRGIPIFPLHSVRRRTHDEVNGVRADRRECSPTVPWEDDAICHSEVPIGSELPAGIVPSGTQ